MSILLDRWPAACRAQGWNKSDRDLRLQVISQAVGREITTMNDLDNSADIDRVYSHLGTLAENVALAAESDDAGYRRRLLWLVRKHSHPLGGQPYVLRLARDKFHITTGLQTVEDLTSDQLNQLMITLNARKSRRQAKAKSEISNPKSEIPSLVESNCPF